MRTYDPALGRFLARDMLRTAVLEGRITEEELRAKGIDLSMNPYVALGNNPLRFVDQDGHAPIPPESVVRKESRLQEIVVQIELLKPETLFALTDPLARRAREEQLSRLSQLERQAFRARSEWEEAQGIGLRANGFSWHAAEDENYRGGYWYRPVDIAAVREQYGRCHGYAFSDKSVVAGQVEAALRKRCVLSGNEARPAHCACLKGGPQLVAMYYARKDGTPSHSARCDTSRGMWTALATLVGKKATAAIVYYKHLSDDRHFGDDKRYCVRCFVLK